MTEELKATLLPCPFCGGDVKHESTITEEVIRCTNCPTGIFYGGSFAATKAMWNTRHLPPDIEAVVETLQHIADSGINGKHYQSHSSLVALAKKAVDALKEVK
jgi:DNA-directed RNA polymerase subunit RPC12/RpoP